MSQEKLQTMHFHVPGEIANNGYAKVFFFWGGGGGGKRGVLWDCASSE